MKLRNDLMHSKPRKTPKHIPALQQRGLAYDPGPGTNISPFDTLTRQMADWAPNAAQAIILAVLDLVPDGPFDPAQMFKSGFRNHTP